MIGGGEMLRHHVHVSVHVTDKMVISRLLLESGPQIHQRLT